jgi:hypothetical protein
LIDGFQFRLPKYAMIDFYSDQQRGRAGCPSG